MRTRFVTLATIVSVGGCGGDSQQGNTTPGDTTEPTQTTEFSVGDAPEWLRGQPFLDGAGLVPGKRANLLLDGAPRGSVVTYLMSDEGTGEGPCLDVYGEVCSDLIDPVVIGAAIGEADGSGDFEYYVEEDEAARTVFLQAWVLDLDTGSSAVSNVLERHVQVPQEQSPVLFTNGGPDAQLPMLATGGNSHTGGNAWVDINNDYLPDLFISNSTGRAHYLFLNLGDGTFEDISERVPKEQDIFESAGVLYVDLENDGDQDIIVLTDSQALMNVAVPQEATGGPNMLYLNDGTGNFTEVSIEWGLRHPLGHRTSCGVLADYDLDGLVDLYTCHWAVMSYPLGVQDNYDRLLRNTGTRFEHELTAVDGYGRDSLVAAFFDMNGDLYPELWVGNVAEHNDPPIEDPKDVFYLNEAGTFVDVTDSIGMGEGMDAWAAMGTTVGDIDNNGTWEFYVTDHWNYPPEPRGNPMYTFNPDGTITENICREAGICAGYLTWPANFADFDHDRWVDLFVGTAWPAHDDLLFMNQRDGTFVVHTQEELSDNASHGGTIADYDLDGDLDYFLFSDVMGSTLYRNDRRTPGGWIQLHLEGLQSNRNAIGAIVRAEADGERMMRTVRGGDSAHSQGQQAVHFGLAEATTTAVDITWPNGLEEDLGSLAANQFYIVREGEGVLVEDLSDSVATYDAGSDTLTVQATSNYGGWTALHVTTVGADMVYDAHAGLWTLDLVLGQTAPSNITIESERGGQWDIAVN